MRRWEDNTRMYLKEIGINMRNSVNSVQDRNYWRAHVSAALNLRVVFCILFVLIGWSLLPNALRPFQIYCAPPKLGITRT
jgi:hypothetical protein